MSSAAQLEIGDYKRPPRVRTLDERFARWLKDRPEVIELCVEIARELKAAEATRISIDMVFHVARFRCLIKRRGAEKWTWNNSFTSRMARTLEATFPDLAGLFETRELHGQEPARAGGDA